MSEPQPSPDKANGERCQRCGVLYRVVYRVPDDVWLLVGPKAGEDGLLCLACVAEAAEQAGIPLFWEAAVGRYPTESEE